MLPEGARNFAFLGQWVEMPEDVVYTVEYSVHCAMHAVYALFGVEKAIPPIYHGLADPKVGIKVLARPTGDDPGFESGAERRAAMATARSRDHRVDLSGTSSGAARFGVRRPAVARPPDTPASQP